MAGSDVELAALERAVSGMEEAVALLQRMGAEEGATERAPAAVERALGASEEITRLLGPVLERERD